MPHEHHKTTTNFDTVRDDKLPVPTRDDINLTDNLDRPEARATKKLPALMLHRYFFEGAARAEYFDKRG